MIMNSHRWFHLGVRFSIGLTLVVIFLGAYVRLEDAGLGCPDWPGCYGFLLAPTQANTIEQANQAFPERPVDVAKAWKEMVHRYAAGMLGLLVLGLALLSWRTRRQPGQPVVLPWVLVGLIVFQSILGMWTVTWQLKPLIVMGHLLGGFSTLTLLWILFLLTRERVAAGILPEEAGRVAERGPVAGSSGSSAPGWSVPADASLRAGRTPDTRDARTARSLFSWLSLATVILIGQIALGGWTSSNYAALACTDFPQCHGSWWPRADYQEAFILWRGTDMDYEFGILDAPARIAIHYTHRMGALLTVLVLGSVLLLILFRGGAALRRTAMVGIGLLILQVLLGISNILLHLPLAVAVAHNVVAALLLLTVVTLLYQMHRLRSEAVVMPESVAAQPFLDFSAASSERSPSR
jgi:cytochrome c oxidase assembly protein subunit 15